MADRWLPPAATWRAWLLRRLRWFSRRRRYESQRVHPDRAPDRGRDHRAARSDRDSEVQQYKGKGVHRVDEVGPPQHGDCGGGLLHRFYGVHRTNGLQHPASAGEHGVVRIDREHARQAQGPSRWLDSEHVERQHVGEVWDLCGRGGEPNRAREPIGSGGCAGVSVAAVFISPADTYSPPLRWNTPSSWPTATPSGP